MKKNIILLGAGGHMTSVIETIQNDKRFNIFGFLDNDKKKLVRLSLESRFLETIMS